MHCTHLKCLGVYRSKRLHYSPVFRQCLAVTVSAMIPHTVTPRLTMRSGLYFSCQFLTAVFGQIILLFQRRHRLYSGCPSKAASLNPDAPLPHVRSKQRLRSVGKVSLLQITSSMQVLFPLSRNPVKRYTGISRLPNITSFLSFHIKHGKQMHVRLVFVQLCIRSHRDFRCSQLHPRRTSYSPGTRSK